MQKTTTRLALKSYARGKKKTTRDAVLQATFNAKEKVVGPQGEAATLRALVKYSETLNFGNEEKNLPEASCKGNRIGKKMARQHQPSKKGKF